MLLENLPRNLVEPHVSTAFDLDQREEGQFGSRGAKAARCNTFNPLGPRHPFFRQVNVVKHENVALLDSHQCTVNSPRSAVNAWPPRMAPSPATQICTIPLLADARSVAHGPCDQDLL